MADDSMHQDELSLPEGVVIFRYPKRIDPEDREDLLEWLNLMTRKVARAVQTAPKPPPSWKTHENVE